MSENETQETVATPKPVKDYMLHIGSQHYPTIEDYINESKEMGVSRRMPSHILPHGLELLGTRIWLAHGLGHSEKKDDEGKPVTGVIFGYFIPNAIQFVAGPDGEVEYADIIADLKGREPGTEVIAYDPAVVEKQRKCGFRKVGGTYMVAFHEGNGISPITELVPHQEFVGHPFRGLFELSPEQVADLEAGRGLHTLVAHPCMECGAETLVSPSTVKLAGIALRAMAKNKEPKFVLRCDECRFAHQKEEVWKTKTKKLADHLLVVANNELLDNDAAINKFSLNLSTYLHRINGDNGKLLHLVSVELFGKVVDSESVKEIASLIVTWIRDGRFDKDRKKRQPRLEVAA